MKSQESLFHEIRNCLEVEGPLDKSVNLRTRDVWPVGVSGALSRTKILNKISVFIPGELSPRVH